MNEWDILQAFSQLDEELIFMPKPAKKSRSRQIRRIALIAAVMILLAGMALAVSLGVKVEHGEEMIELQGLSLNGNAKGGQSYYTAKIEYDFCPMQIKNLALLQQALLEAEDSDSADLKNADGSRLCFATISEAEEFFGIDLMQSAKLDEFVRGIYVSVLRTDENVPSELVLYVSLRRGSEADGMFDMQAVSECGITIYIALGEDAENTKCLYSHKKEGKFQESGMLTEHNDSILLLENSPADGYVQTGYAAWCKNGIAYLAHVKVYPNSYATPLALLTPILSQIQ